MIDREKVVEGIDICLGRFRCGTACPYYAISFNTRCMEQLRNDVLALLKEQESEWLEDSDPGQEYGTTWACRKCMHSIHKPFVWNPYDSKMEYCPFCRARMVVNVDAETSTKDMPDMPTL